MADKTATYVLLGKDQSLGSTLKNAAKDFDEVDAKSKHLGNAFKDLGESAAGLFVLGKVKDFFVGSVTAASDLNETVSKTQQVFGATSPEIIKFGQSAATALGMSETQALDASDRFGNLFKNIGLTTGNAAIMSTQLVKTSADLASFHNTSPQEMLDAMASALAGEYDPLQRFGFAISAAAVQQQALKMGLVQTKAEITPAISAQATYALVLAQTGAAQGDFQRTSSGLANQQRILSAEFTNLQANMGNALLPTINLVVGAVNKLLGAFGSLPSWLQQAVVGLGVTTVGVMAGGMAFLKAKDAVTELGTALSGFKSKGVTEAADGMEKAAASSGKLRTAVGAVGSFLTGPWGIALAAGTAVLGVWAAKHAEAQARVDEMTQAIQKDSGALGDNTRALTVNALESDGVLKSAQRLGVNLTDITDAAMGNAAAQARVTAALQEQGVAYAAATQQGPDVARAHNQQIADIQAIIGAVSAQNGTLKDAQAAVARYNAAMTSTAGASKGAAGGTVAFTNGLDKQTQAEKDADAALKVLNGELDTSKNALLGAFGEETSYYAAVDKATAAIKTNGATLDAHTAKGQANRQALADMVNESSKYLQATLANIGPGQQFTSTLDATRSTLVTLATQMGMSRGEARLFVDQMLAVPDAKSIAWSNPGLLDAISNSAKLGAGIRDVPTSHNTTITANTSDALSKLRGLQGVLDAIPRSVAIGVALAVSGIPKASGGWIPGAPSNVDSVPLLAAPGEYVVNSAAAQQWGPVLEAINAGRSPSGLGVSGSTSSHGGAGGGGTTVYNVTIHAGAVGSEEYLARTLDDAFDRIAARGGR